MGNVIKLRVDLEKFQSALFLTFFSQETEILVNDLVKDC